MKLLQNEYDLKLLQEKQLYRAVMIGTIEGEGDIRDS